MDQVHSVRTFPPILALICSNGFRETLFTDGSTVRDDIRLLHDK